MALSPVSHFCFPEQPTGQLFARVASFALPPVDTIIPAIEEVPPALPKDRLASLKLDVERSATLNTKSQAEWRIDSVSTCTWWTCVDWCILISSASFPSTTCSCHVHDSNTIVTVVGTALLHTPPKPLTPAMPLRLTCSNPQRAG